MCNGTIMDKLIAFSLPLMLTSILQLMFNAVDIIVIGRFTTSQALAAVERLQQDVAAAVGAIPTATRGSGPTSLVRSPTPRSKVLIKSWGRPA